MTTRNSRGIHEEFARFFEKPTREALRNILQNHFGEENHLDFKAEFPTYSKLARHLLALANYGGGVIVIGVSQETDTNSLNPVGLSTLIDKSDIQKGIQKFLSERLRYEVLDFSYTESEYPVLKGKNFQVLIIEDNPKYIPFVAEADGEGIRKSAIYTRRGTNSEEASYEEIQEIINRRLQTTYSSQEEFTLEKNLSILKTLYSEISQFTQTSPFAHFTLNSFGLLSLKPNPNYPKEDYEQFIIRMINKKKKKIEDSI